MIRKFQAHFCAILTMLTMASCMAPVVIDTVPETAPAPQPPWTSPPPKPTIVDSELPTIQFTIQVGAFSTVERAAAYATGLIGQGLDAYYFIDEDGLCKVRFERFDTREAAHQRAVALQALGWIEAFFIVEPRFLGDTIDPREFLRKNILRTASRFIGTPYRWGGESALRGFDCSGLTMTVYRLNGLDLPRNSRAQFQVGSPVQRDALQPGDLVFFATDGKDRVSHVGVYRGNDKFIHAPGRGKRIRISSLSNEYFKRRFLGARRYF